MNFRIILAPLSVVLIAVSAAVLADGLAGPSSFDLTWHTIDAGGGISTGPSLQLHGTIGQPDAGFTLVGGNLELNGGFWPASSTGVNPCPADVNGDLMVSITDLLAVISSWGQTGPNPADVNSDGVVNIADLLAVIAAWGACPS
jgi:hypothetical protein